MAGPRRLEPLKPAGYLPYYPPRFVSQAEQAAEKIPEQIKSQSLKNALLRQGAKPAELEYAGLDDFIAKQAGGMARRGDVLDFLKQEGPLGQLKRVEQQVGPGEQVELGIAPKPPSYAENVRSPFDPATASDNTQYHQYTVPGQKGDFRGYREVLLEDPRNRPAGSSLIPSVDAARANEIQALQEEYDRILRGYGMTGHQDIDWEAVGDPGYMTQFDADRVQQLDDELHRLMVGEEMELNPRGDRPIDAHSADYWARYNEYPDRIAVQNIQSDAGQNVSNHGSNQLVGGDDGTRITIPEAIEQFHKKRDEMQAALDAGGDQTLRIEIAEIDEEIAKLANSQRPTSPLAKDDNWKNLMARHIALQSIAGGGKPITIPTGKQMVEAEGFGLQTHGSNTEAATKAASSYNEDLVRRLQKIFRGLDPGGASVEAHRHLGPLPITGMSKRAAAQEAKDFHAQLRRPLEDMHQSQAELLWEQRFNDGEYSRAADAAARHHVENFESMKQTWNLLGEEDAGFSLQDLLEAERKAIVAADFLEKSDRAMAPFTLEREVAQGLPHADRAVYNALGSGDIPALQRAVSGQQAPSAPYLDAAMKAIQRNAALFEMGNPGVVSGGPDLPALPRGGGPTEDPFAPGWTIKPSPEAVRAALRHGLPIMSIAPALIAGDQE
jgi:hypothetical protein